MSEEEIMESWIGTYLKQGDITNLFNNIDWESEEPEEVIEYLFSIYEQLQNDVDTFCELGLAIGVDETTMLIALDTYNEVEIINRNSRDSYIIVKELFDEIVAQINRISGLPADVINRLQEAQEYYRVEAGFKLFRATIDDIES